MTPRNSHHFSTILAHATATFPGLYGLWLTGNQGTQKRQQATQEEGDQQSAKAKVSTFSKVQTKQSSQQQCLLL